MKTSRRPRWKRIHRVLSESREPVTTTALAALTARPGERNAMTRTWAVLVKMRARNLVAAVPGLPLVQDCHGRHAKPGQTRVVRVTGWKLTRGAA